LRCQEHPDGRQHRLRDLPHRHGARFRQAPLQPQGPPGEPASHRGRRERHEGADRGARVVGRQRGAQHGDPVHAGARGHAGLHRPQRRAVPVPPLGPDRVPGLQGRAPRHRHRPPGEHRAPGEGHLRPHQRRRPPGLPRHL
ncbi:unnamed protein product, partial [Penicillium discolor]